MMRFTTRTIWSAVAIAGVASASSASTESPAVPASPLASAANRDRYPGGNFTAALEKMFMGEGGEGGLGYRSHANALELPLLTEAQLRYAVTGNTIRKNFIYAIHLDPSGAAMGWFRDWEKVSVEMCSTHTRKDGYYSDAVGDCHKEKVTPVSGKWQVKGNRICLPDVAERDGRDGCFRMAFFMNSVVLLDNKGKIQGEEMYIAKGQELVVETI
jgi:hypothetical protein